MPEPPPNLFQQQVQTAPEVRNQQLTNLLGALGGPLVGGQLGIDPASPSCTWKYKWGQAERRALRLFRDMYGQKAMLRLLVKGHHDFKAKDGRIYRIYREQYREVDVYQRTKQGLKKCYRLCLLDTEQIPLTDSVMKRLWLAKADPGALHEQAHVKSA